MPAWEPDRREWVAIALGLIIALGLACPWWSLPLLGAATGTSDLLTPTLGLVSGIAVVLW